MGTKCRTKGCSDLPKCRGLCNGCYTRFFNAVKNGETTWEELEANGLVRRKFPPRSPASKALAQIAAARGAS